MEPWSPGSKVHSANHNPPISQLQIHLTFFCNFTRTFIARRPTPTTTKLNSSHRQHAFATDHDTFLAALTVRISVTLIATSQLTTLPPKGPSRTRKIRRDRFREFQNATGPGGRRRRRQLYIREKKLLGCQGKKEGRTVIIKTIIIIIIILASRFRRRDIVLTRHRFS